MRIRIVFASSLMTTRSANCNTHIPHSNLVLHVARALGVRGRETKDGVGLGLALALVGGLLPLAVHRDRALLAERLDEKPRGVRKAADEGDATGDGGVVRGGLLARAVRNKVG